MTATPPKDATSQNYPHYRNGVAGPNIVATSQPLAVESGLRALRAGGNAVDAALAAAITLTVVEPTMNGIGGDALAFVWDGSALHALNATGRSPAQWNPERFTGQTSIPLRGWESVTVPGGVSSWVTLSEKFGRLAFEDLFSDAIGYARNGFKVTPKTATLWSQCPEGLLAVPGFKEAFLPGGRAPTSGEIFKFEAQASTLEEIARTRGESFYRGRLAECIVRDAEKHGSVLSREDMAAHCCNWVTPMSREIKGSKLWEMPPNSQGIAALIALGIIEHTPAATLNPDDPTSIHFQIEAIKLAYADTNHFVADPESMDINAQTLLSDAYLRSRANLINPKKALTATHGSPKEGGTVYVTAADQSGMMVSFIQSNWWGFGSGVVIPDTGISMHNRGTGFNLIKGHPNCVSGGRRPFHTIIPAFVTRGSEAVSSFGVMGGSFQSQGHVQMMVRIWLAGQDPQVASDAPRWRFVNGLEVKLEDGIKMETIEVLKDLGHDVKIEQSAAFGGAQIIIRDNDGSYLAASDHRKDGFAGSI